MDSRDETLHGAGDHPAWSESYYFNFYDPKSQVGMFARMAFRLNEGTVDGLMVLYLGGHRVAFTYTRERLDGPVKALKAGGLSLELEHPFKTWHVRYSGPAQDIADDRILVTRRKERPDGWFTPATVEMDLTFEGSIDPYYTLDDAGGERNHFEQPGRVTGTVKVGDESWDVDGFGVRDKSWGPRTWQAGGSSTSDTKTEQPAGPAPFVNWLSMNFGPSFAIGASCGLRDGVMRGAGWIQRDGMILALKDIRVESQFEPDSILHKSLVFTGTDEMGVEHRVEGELLTVTPTKIPMPGAGATFVNEGLARYTLDGQTGYGIAEYWHTVE